MNPLLQLLRFNTVNTYVVVGIVVNALQIVLLRTLISRNLNASTATYAEGTSLKANKSGKSTNIHFVLSLKYLQLFVDTLHSTIMTNIISSQKTILTYLSCR